MMHQRTIIIFAPNGEEVGEIDVEDFEKSSREKPFIPVAHNGKIGGLRVPASDVYPIGHERYGNDLFLPKRYRAVMGDGIGGRPELRADLVPRGARVAEAAPIAGSTDARLEGRVDTIRAQLAAERERRQVLERRMSRLEKMITTKKD